MPTVRLLCFTSSPVPHIGCKKSHGSTYGRILITFIRLPSQRGPEPDRCTVSLFSPTQREIPLDNITLSLWDIFIFYGAKIWATTLENGDTCGYLSRLPYPDIFIIFLYQYSLVEATLLLLKVDFLDCYNRGVSCFIAVYRLGCILHLSVIQTLACTQSHR